MVQSFYCVFHGKGKAGRGNGLGLASLNDVGRLWAIWVGSVVVWVIQGRRNIGLVCQLKEVVGGLDPELIGGSVLGFLCPLQNLYPKGDVNNFGNSFDPRMNECQFINERL